MDHRLSGPHRDLPKVQFHALLGERRFDEIMIADRGPSERDQEIGAGGARGVDAFFERAQLILGNAKIERLAARRLDERGDREKEFEAMI